MILSAQQLLAEALRDGALVRDGDVRARRHRHTARTYLADGSGLEWRVPPALCGRATFVIDAEIPAPVRGSLVRRYGVVDPLVFARDWTRAEALAKLDDLPIVTWLSMHGLDVPGHVESEAQRERVAWRTEVREDYVITFACRVKPSE